MTERAAILRAIDGRTAAGATQQFFLRVARDGDGTIMLTLCDGCTTWRGLLTVAPALGAASLRPMAHTCSRRSAASTAQEPQEAPCR